MIESDKSQNRRKILFFGLCILAIFFFFYFLISPNKKYNTIKVKEKQSYQHASSLISHLPYLEYDNLDVELVNKEMSEDYQNIIMNQDSQFTYQYTEGKKYLSLVTMLNQIDSKTGYPYPTFKTYVFDKKTKKRVTDEELLERFQVTKEEIDASFDKKMQEYYQGELDSFYLKQEECDYACFLERRRIDKNDKFQLYVVRDQLKFYRGFMVFSNDNDEEDFYRNETFLFDIER